MQKIINQILELLESDKACVSAVVVSSSGSTPAAVGSRMIVTREGRIAGTVGGGGLEKMAVADALEALKARRPVLKEYALNPKAGVQICGGKVKIFFDVISKPRRLVIAGGGHIGLSLSAIGKLLGYEVTIVDNRREYADKQRFPHADRIFCGAYEKVLGKIGVDKNTYVVIVTHGHVHDSSALKAALKTDAGYIGMIGSKAKIKHVFGQMRKLGFSNKRLREVHTPIGLSIGAQTPAEIAVAIAAELVQVSKKQAEI